MRGRRRIFESLENTVTHEHPVVWMHCASLGEFEQGRPLLEKLKLLYPGHKFLLTFFSPSGYEVRKDFKGADWVFYVPMDGAANARRFLEIVQPALVIFVKYEFWYYYLKKIKYRQIPLILVSALFWENMSFFRWYGALQRKMLSRFDQLFVQNEESRQLIAGIGLAGITTVSGDTRFDRVIEIAEKTENIPAIEKFCSDSRVIVAGSTWPEDELALAKTMDNRSLKLILAPHEIDEKHLLELKQLFPQAILYSELIRNGAPTSSRVLIIDNIGMLSRLYKFAYIAYIGGGFGKGIHNTVEAAVYGRPVLFGPVYQKFNEAKDLINNGAATSISSADDLTAVVTQLLHDQADHDRRCREAFNYVYANKGATDKITAFIHEKRLLTS